MPARSEIFDHMVKLLDELFEIDPSKVTESSLLYEDLDLDSIDAVDLIVKLKDYTGKKIDPAAFKDVRTIGDVVSAVEALFQENSTQTGIAR